MDYHLTITVTAVLIQWQCVDTRYLGTSGYHSSHKKHLKPQEIYLGQSMKRVDEKVFPVKKK
jgi:hypothetical protein